MQRLIRLALFALSRDGKCDSGNLLEETTFERAG